VAQAIPDPSRQDADGGSHDQTCAAFARFKVIIYFSSGARLVWLVDPFRREVRVYRATSRHPA